MVTTDRRRFLAAGGAALAGSAIAVSGAVSSEEPTPTVATEQGDDTADRDPSGWSMHRGGPGHAGAATWTNGPRSEPDVAWNYSPESADGQWRLTEPAVVDGTVYFGATFIEDNSDDPQTAEVVALDAGDGANRWSHEVACVSLGTPAVSDGRVFVTDSIGRVHALDADTGDSLWTEEVALVSGSTSHLAVADSVFVTGDATYALDPESGSVRWETDDLRRPSTDGDRVYGYDTVEDDAAANPKDLLVAADATTGERTWSYTLPGWEHTGARDSSPLVRDGVVLGVMGGIDAFHAVNARTGEELWSGRTDGYPRFSLDGERCYVLDRHALFGARDAETGEVVWSTDDFTGEQGVPPVVGGATVYAYGEGPPGPGLVAFDAPTGDVLWVGEGQPVAVADGTLYVSGGRALRALR